MKVLTASEERARVKTAMAGLRILAGLTEETKIRRQELFDNPETTTKGPTWHFNFFCKLVARGLLCRTPGSKGFIAYYWPADGARDKLLQLANDPSTAFELTQHVRKHERPNGKSKPPTNGEAKVESDQSVPDSEPSEPLPLELSAEAEQPIEEPGIPPNEDKLDGVVKMCWHTLQTVLQLKSQIETQSKVIAKMDEELRTQLYG